MKRRVGIARALSIEPKIMLMDEPFSALDALTRGTFQGEVSRICPETRQPLLTIAHGIGEASRVTRNPPVRPGGVLSIASTGMLCDNKNHSHRTDQCNFPP